MKTIEEAKAAVERGETVHWHSAAYRLRKDTKGGWWVDCSNGSIVPLDGHKAEDLYSIRKEGQTTETRQQVGAGERFLVFDADAKPIYVGDTLEWQETAGPYGQTCRGRGTVTSPSTRFGHIVTTGGPVNCHWEWKPKDGPEGLYCRHENHTYDHAHKTWARIVTAP